MNTCHIALACFLAGTAFGEPPDPLPVAAPPIYLGFASSCVQGQEGATFRFTVAAVRLMQTPAWSPGKGPPPVSLDQALAIAQRWLSTANPKLVPPSPHDFHLSYVASYLDGSREGRWFWSIAFHASSSEYAAHSAPRDAYVLMDGSIVEPRVTSPCTHLPH
jgi:hypothetical protein